MPKLICFRFRFYIDPALSLFLVLLIMFSTWPLLTESALILLQTVPAHINVNLLRQKLLNNVEGVWAVHELHIWQLTGDKIIAAAHVKCLNTSDNERV